MIYFYCQDREVAVPHLLSSSKPEWGIWLGQIHRHIPPFENSLLIFDIHCFHRISLSFRWYQHTHTGYPCLHTSHTVTLLNYLWKFHCRWHRTFTHLSGPQHISLESGAVLIVGLVHLRPASPRIL